MSDDLTRDFVVPVYALAILQEAYCRPPLARHEWRAINEAIHARWSWHAVTYIKRQAWAMAKGLANAR